MSFVSVHSAEYHALLELEKLARAAAGDLSLSALMDLEIACLQVQEARDHVAAPEVEDVAGVDRPRDTLRCLPPDEDDLEVRMVRDAAEILRGVAVR